MSEYETEVLIDELQKLVVSKEIENRDLKFTNKRLKAEVARLEELLTPTISEKDKPLAD